jgi:hypothetical protein
VRKTKRNARNKLEFQGFNPQIVFEVTNVIIYRSPESSQEEGKEVESRMRFREAAAWILIVVETAASHKP